MLLLGFLFWPRGYCGAAYRKYSIEVPVCPDGTPRPLVAIQAYGLHRGGDGQVAVDLLAAYTTAAADSWREAAVEEFEVSLSLVDSNGDERPLEPEEPWEDLGSRQLAKVVLPEVRDGDYVLRAHVTSPLGESTGELPLGLYAPAKVHVLTDRPLYEPGHEVEMRALVARARDLTPIDHRPGTWLVMNPAGEVLLEEKAPAGEWGVVAGSFPLDPQATPGTWSVVWRSGADEGRASFRVEPFTLPRFRVEASTDRTFYRAGQTPTVRGNVVYSAGTPVAGATVAVEWSVSGSWPPPNAWLSGGLPTQARADEAGQFTLTLPEVPADLMGQATLRARLIATDEAGDRVAGSLSILLSEDAIRVDTVTELADGLVAGANNRLYLRVTRADGRPLPGAEIAIARAWLTGAEADTALQATLDEDSVARVQLDPGPPVSVVVPPVPVRPQQRARVEPVVITSVTDLLSSEADRSPSMVDRLAIERWLEALSGCGKWVVDSADEVALGVRVSSAGAVTATSGTRSRLSECLEDTLRRQRLPAAGERLYALTLRVAPAPLPRLIPVIDALPADSGDVSWLVEISARAARDCLPAAPWVSAEQGRTRAVPWLLEWRLGAGQRRLSTSWVRADGAMPAGLSRCIQTPLAAASLDEPSEVDRIGVIRYSVVYPGADAVAEPEPTVMLGYELAVEVTDSASGEVIGATRVRMHPGQIPDLRLRADPVLAKPGQSVEFTLLRGPSFTGELPYQVVVDPSLGKREELRFEKDSPTKLSYQVPADARGWITATAGGERAVVYVPSDEQLGLEIEPDKPQYAPGQQATLTLTTRVGGRGAQAAALLVGVDETLGQLVALPGPDELSSMRPEIPMQSQAFAALDAQALTLGRIRGQFAAEATILRVAEVPAAAELEAMVNSSSRTVFDPVVELTDRFYIALAELHVQTRRWERDAAADQTMTPPTMAKLWKDALEALKKRGQEVEDSFGRPLRLHRLPPDLLALTAPREVVVVGTRLPEDIEPWQSWVAENQP
ncbi:MAG: hypothetical protein Tsb0020_23300 [Haliangiales bacterium]